MESVLEVPEAFVADPVIFVRGCPSFAKGVARFVGTEFSRTELAMIMIPVGLGLPPLTTYERDASQVFFLAG
jgi:hypothetical protein